MLEIIALIVLWKEMGKTLRKKGRKPLFMQIAVIVGWFGGMFLAAVAYGIYLGITDGPEATEEIGFVIYPCMLAGAALSQITLFLIARMLSNKLPPPVPGGSSLAKYSSEPT